MHVIHISVKFRFSIRKFPVNLFEIFLVVKAITTKAAQEIAVVFIKHLEDSSWLFFKSHGYRNLGYQKRTFRGCLGEITTTLLRIRKGKGKIRYAVQRKINMPSYVRLTDDAYETSLGLLPHVSYRRSISESTRIEETAPGKSSLHRHLKKISPQLEVHPDRHARGYEYLMVDGTGIKIQERVSGYGFKKVETRRGEIRVVYAAKQPNGPYRVIGRWASQETWQEIAEETYKRIDADCLKVLISDGEIGIDEAFKKRHMKHQRCSVHAWREMKIFLYLDGLKKAGQEAYHQRLKDVPVFDYAKQDVMENLNVDDRPEIRQVIKTSKEQLEELVRILEKKGYAKTAVYIDRLSKPLLTFLEEWVKTGEWAPSTSNIAENRFSLFKNRIADIGKRWSESGLKRFFDLTVHKLFPGYNWDDLMGRILPSSGNISCVIESVVAT